MMTSISNKQIARWLHLSLWLKLICMAANGISMLDQGICYANPTQSPSEDVVVVRTNDPDVVAKRKGEITSWTGTELSITIGGTSRAVPNEQIVRLEVAWGEDYLSALGLLEQRRFPESVPKLTQALAAEKRPWAANIIRNDLIRVLSIVGADAEAVKQFLVILGSDPETRFVEFAPFAWDTGLVDPQLEELAKLALKAKEPYAQLLGASWLLGSTDRSQAMAKLKELSRDIRPVVAHLATAQVWRSEHLTARQTDVDRWARQVERMPREIRAGPLFILGQSYERLEKQEEALLSLLEVPILHEEHFRLSALAQTRAARILDTSGKPREARKAWSEIASKFPQTNWANEAQSRLRKE